MTQNLLKLNDDKTELLLLMRRNVRNISPVSHIDLNMVPVHPSTTIRNLGAMFDHHMDMKSFVNMKCKATMHSLRNISCVRRSLKTEACKTLVQAYVTSKLDYCNSLLYGIPDSLVHKLKRVQHYAARVITMTRKYDHIKPVLSRLHWLPIEQRIQFKLLLYVYKALHGLAPAYLSDMLVPYQPCRPLRSSKKSLLEKPRFKLASYGGGAFTTAAPRLWNDLPEDVKASDSVSSFKKRLKTHLFQRAQLTGV